MIVTDNTIQQMDLDRKALGSRPDAVRNEIAETQIKLAELTNAFTKLDVKDASPLMRANYTRDLVVIYGLQDRKLMLEQELASLPAQQQIRSRRISRGWPSKSARQKNNSSLAKRRRSRAFVQR